MDKKNLKGLGAAAWVSPVGRTLRQAVTLVASLALVLAPAIWAADGRTVLKPGWNMFSPQQDVEVGQQVSVDAERQLSMLNNSRVDNYLNNLGRRLSANAPGEKYPYQFKVVNDRTINAFALPGGPVYIHRGVIEAADNESQLASVIAHETSHVALRHGTNQASKASAAQLPLAILGGMLGSNSTKAVLAQLGASFALNSILLKYSRTAESQADIMGTQILYDSGYDPRAMAQFFEKIEAQQKGSGPVEFFSNHPSPDNRIERVNQEVEKLGGVRGDFNSNSREFDDIKRYLQTLPGPRGQQWQAGGQSGGQYGTPELRIVAARYGASSRFIDVRERMQSRIQNDRLNLLVNNSSMGGNPTNQAKALQVRYEWDNRTYDITVQENQRLSIPSAQQVGDINSGNDSAPELQIVAARYGASNRFIDVRERMQSRIQNDRLNLLVNNSSMGGNPTNQAKALQVRYEWDNRTYDLTVQENQRLSIPTAQQVNDANTGNSGSGSTSDWPSERFVSVENALLLIQHPDNWQAYGQGDAMTIAPRSGLIDDGQGNQALAYGVIVNIFEPRADYNQQLQGPGYGESTGQTSATRLDQFTDQLVGELRLSNRNMRVIRYREVISVDNQRALSTYLSNDSPVGGRETDWLITVERPEGVVFIVFTAPERDFQSYESAFHQMLRSVRLKR